MTKSEGTGGKLVENGGIAPVVIPLVVAITLKSQLVKIDGIPAQNARQKFIPRDVLLDGRHNSSGFLNIYNQKKIIHVFMLIYYPNITSNLNCTSI